MDRGDLIGVAFKQAFVGHGLDVPDFEIIFVDDRGDGLAFVGEEDGPTFLGEFEDNAFEIMSVPSPESFIISNGDEVVAVFGELDWADDIEMGFDFFELFACLSGEHNKVVATTQDNLFGIPWNSTAEGGELNLILFNQETNIIHDSGVNGTV